MELYGQNLSFKNILVEVHNLAKLYRMIITPFRTELDQND